MHTVNKCMHQDIAHIKHSMAPGDTCDCFRMFCILPKHELALAI